MGCIQVVPRTDILHLYRSAYFFIKKVSLNVRKSAYFLELLLKTLQESMDLHYILYYTYTVLMESMKMLEKY